MRTKILLVGCMGMVLSLNACGQRVDTVAEEASIRERSQRKCKLVV